MSDVHAQQRQPLGLQPVEAEIFNKLAGTALNNEQRRWQPWKAMAAAFATGFIALATWALSHIIRQAG